jgi:hypothetical protein
MSFSRKYISRIIDGLSSTGEHCLCGPRDIRGAIGVRILVLLASEKIATILQDSYRMVSAVQ